MNSLKKVFSLAAMAVGGGGAVWAGLGVAVGGWSTAGELGGVNLTPLGVALTLISAGVFYAGYKGLTSAIRSEARTVATPTKDDQRPDFKP